MNTLAIINLARRYAKNIVTKNFPDLPKAEATRKAKKLAESKRLRGQWIVSAYTEAYDKGHAAYSADEPLIANPYLSGAFKALAWAWAYGWLDAQTEDRGIGGTG